MFPLPLTPFEYYYWCDDRPEYPTAYAFELTFGGPLDQGLIEQALATAYVRHPLLRARIEDNGGGACWIEGSANAPPIDWAEDDAPIQHSDGPRIDLRRDCGLRVWVRRRAGETLLRLQFHHACGDGLGALRFIEDLLLAYHQLYANRNTEPKLAQLAQDRLTLRASFAENIAAGKKWRKTVYDICCAARQWASILLRPAAPLAIPRGAIGGCEDEPVLAFTTAVLDEDLHKRLRETARQRGATFNDLLLCEMFRALGQWQAEHGGKSGPLRINVPVSFRTPRDHLLPMANRLSFAFLPRGDEGRLLVGSARLVRVAVAPPVRPLTRAAIAVIQYAGETTFNLRVDPTCLSRREAAAFLEAYLGRLREEA